MKETLFIKKIITLKLVFYEILSFKQKNLTSGNLSSKILGNSVNPLLQNSDYPLLRNNDYPLLHNTMITHCYEIVITSVGRASQLIGCSNSAPPTTR